MRTKITLEPSWPDLDRWWRKSPYFRLDHGHEVPIDGGGLAYGAFWKPKAFTAWTYEIVRRLPYFKAFEKRIAANDLSD